MARILDFQSSGRGSIPRRRTFWLAGCGRGSSPRPIWLEHRKASIAQMVERKTLNLVVVGSIPTGGAFWRREPDRAQKSTLPFQTGLGGVRPVREQPIGKPL